MTLSYYEVLVRTVTGCALASGNTIVSTGGNGVGNVELEGIGEL